MSESAKRSIQVNVRLSEQDFDLIKKASAKIWPNAVLTNSGVLLGLARLAAKRVLDRPRDKRVPSDTVPDEAVVASLFLDQRRKLRQRGRGESGPSDMQQTNPS